MTTQTSFDVIIVGAGLSGIGAAVHLQRKCPERSYTILEARDAIGGTWDLFRYPGVRSDSDMHTLGYEFKPWRAAEAIADGPSILHYLNETVDEYGVREHIRFSHRVTAANWSSEDELWSVTLQHGDGTTAAVTANMLLMCGGYYSFDEPHAAQLRSAAAMGVDLAVGAEGGRGAVLDELQRAELGQHGGWEPIEEGGHV